MLYYNFKEYEPVFDTPSKREQERMVANKIMDLLNKNKYNSLEEFIEKNKSYQDFLKNNSMRIVSTHFGTTLTEDDYIKILENLRTLTMQKKDFDKENIRTSNIDDKQYNIFEGEDKTYYIDNSKGDKPIEEQMNAMQTQSQDFGTSNKTVNTENMFKELEKRKQTLNFKSFNEIDYDLLNEEQKAMYRAARIYSHDTNKPIKIDLDRGIIIDENNNISKIETKNGQYVITNDNDPSNEKNQNSNTYQYQKKLTPRTDTLYTD